MSVSNNKARMSSSTSSPSQPPRLRNSRNQSLSQPSANIHHGSRTPTSTTSRIISTPTWTSSSTTTTEADRPRMYLLNTRCEARLPSWAAYYPGHIMAVNQDGSLLIFFDDGDLRDSVPLSQIRFESRNEVTTTNNPSSHSVPLSPGTFVEGNFDPITQRWFPGIVIHVTNKTLCTVQFADGTMNRLERSQLRCYSPSPDFVQEQEMIEILRGKKFFRAIVMETGHAVRLVETGENISFTNEDENDPAIIRYPWIDNIPVDVEDNLFPMILSVQERQTQSVDVGSRVIICDKHGGALPRIGKADSAQVSIINFAVPADGVVDSITLRLAEPPAEGSNTWDVIIFERFQDSLPWSPPSPSSTSQQQQQQQQTDNPTDVTPPITRFSIATEYPHRPNRSSIQFDPNSTVVQTVPVLGRLRVSAGQYIGVMNRYGRLNVAYTPDKKKPGESWTEKSIEVFYMMPKMVPRPFVGGPHPTRDWHGRAGWFASLTVTDPEEAVDPLWQKACTEYVLLQLCDHDTIHRCCWLLDVLIKDECNSARDVLCLPGFLTGLKHICDSVLQLESSSLPAEQTATTVDLWLPLIHLITTLLQRVSVEDDNANLPKTGLYHLEKVLRRKAMELGSSTSWIQTSNANHGTKFQRLLKCLTAMRHVLGDTRLLMPRPRRTHDTIIALLPGPIDAGSGIYYHLTKSNSLLVASITRGKVKVDVGDELVSVNECNISTTPWWMRLLAMTGPMEHSALEECYFDSDTMMDAQIKTARDWFLAPVKLGFRAPMVPPPSLEPDWLDDLDNLTGILSSFATRENPTTKFLVDRLVCWKQQTLRVKVESEHPIRRFDGVDVREHFIRIEGASRLGLEWDPRCRLRDDDGSALEVNIGGDDISSCMGRCGLPPPISMVDGDSVCIRVVPATPFDPGEMIRTSRAAESAVFALAVGLRNAQAMYVPKRGTRFCCRTCSDSMQPCDACLAMGSPANIEGRVVSPSTLRDGWTCSVCVVKSKPCKACAVFPDSIARVPVFARPISSFRSTTQYEMFLRRILVPGTLVYVRLLAGSGGGDDDHDVDDDSPKVAAATTNNTRVSPSSSLSVGPPSVITSGVVTSQPPIYVFQQIESFNSNICIVVQTVGERCTRTCMLSDLTLVPEEEQEEQIVVPPTSSTSRGGDEGIKKRRPPMLRHPSGATTFPSIRDETQQSSSLSTTSPSPDQQRHALFASETLGPDIALSNGGRTATRLRSAGWGTQRLTQFLDASCGSAVVTFTIDRNSSNHLFFGVVGLGFNDWTRRMSEPGSWAIRRDGSLHADGRERRGSDSTARLVTGEHISLVVDMFDRTISFLQGSTMLGTLSGLPPVVVPAVSFGGSNQIVTVSSLIVGRAPVAGPQIDWGFQLNVVPLYDLTSPTILQSLQEELDVARHDMWTIKQDCLVVAMANHVATEKRLVAKEMTRMKWSDCDVNNYNEIPGKTWEEIGRRYEWIRALNSAALRALGLLDLTDWRITGSLAQHLSECSLYFYECLKRPLWTEALEATRTEEGQFELILDYGRALSHRADLPDVHARHTVFAQAFAQISTMNPLRLRGKGQIYRATLRGMRAHDDGGPYRQSFQTYCAELQSVPGAGLFLPCANRVNEIHSNRDRWLPNPSATQPIQLHMFEFVGQLMGIAIRNREYLDLRLPSMVWKRLVNQKVTREDLRSVDVLFVNTIEALTDNNSASNESTVVSDFTVYSLDGRLIDLNGGNTLLPKEVKTEEDARVWAQLAEQYKMNEFEMQLDAIRRGLASVIPQLLLCFFTWDELEMMVCGRPKVDLDLLRQMTVYVGCTEKDLHIQHFWRVLASFTEEECAMYLRFVWGRSRLPVSREAWGDMPHKISVFEVSSTGSHNRRAVTPDDLLPRSHTCYFSLDLPRYSTEEVLRKKLSFAIQFQEIDADQTTTGVRSAALGFELFDAVVTVDVAGGGTGAEVAVVMEDGSPNTQVGETLLSEDEDDDDSFGDAEDLIGIGGDNVGEDELLFSGGTTTYGDGTLVRLSSSLFVNDLGREIDWGSEDGDDDS